MNDEQAMSSDDAPSTSVQAQDSAPATAAAAAPVKLPSISSLLQWPGQPEQPAVAHKKNPYDREFTSASATTSGLYPDASTSSSLDQHRGSDPATRGGLTSLRTSLSSTRTSVGSALASPEGGPLFPYPSGLVGSPLLKPIGLANPDDPRGREQQVAQPRRRRSSSLSNRSRHPYLPDYSQQHPQYQQQQGAFPRSWERSSWSLDPPPPPSNRQPDEFAGFDFPRPVQRPEPRTSSYLPEPTSPGQRKRGDSTPSTRRPRRSSIGTTDDYRPIPAWGGPSDYLHAAGHPQVDSTRDPAGPLPPSMPHPPTSMPQDTRHDRRPTTSGPPLSEGPVFHDWRTGRPYPAGLSPHLPPTFTPTHHPPAQYMQYPPYGPPQPPSSYGPPPNWPPEELPRLPPGASYDMSGSQQQLSGDYGPAEDYGDGAKYSCPHCTKRFARPSSLRIHIHSHTGEKPFECKHCGRAFSVQSNLRRHVKIHANVGRISTDVPDSSGGGTTSGTSSGGGATTISSASTSGGGSSSIADDRRGSAGTSAGASETSASDDPNAGAALSRASTSNVSSTGSAEMANLSLPPNTTTAAATVPAPPTSEVPS